MRMMKAWHGSKDIIWKPFFLALISIAAMTLTTLMKWKINNFSCGLHTPILVKNRQTVQKMFNTPKQHPIAALTLKKLDPWFKWLNQETTILPKFQSTNTWCDFDDFHALYNPLKIFFRKIEILWKVISLIWQCSLITFMIAILLTAQMWFFTIIVTLVILLGQNYYLATVKLKVDIKL